MAALVVLDWFFLGYLKEQYQFFDLRFDVSFPYNYNSIFACIESISIFLIFLKIKIRTKVGKGIIKFIAPHVFAVYLCERSYASMLSFDLTFQLFDFPNLIYLRVVLVVIFLFAIRVLVDYVRSLLFKLFEDRKWYKTFLTKMDAFPYWVVNKINKKGEKTA